MTLSIFGKCEKHISYPSKNYVQVVAFPLWKDVALTHVFNESNSHCYLRYRKHDPTTDINTSMQLLNLYLCWQY